jgi:hypothetical protein
MRKLPLVLSIFFAAFQLISCSKTIGTETASTADGSTAGYAAAPGPGGGGGNGGNGNPGGSPGVVTAGEWNELDNWDYWNKLLQRDTIKTFPGIWQFYTNNRITVILKDANNRLSMMQRSAWCNGKIRFHQDRQFWKAGYLLVCFQQQFILSKFYIIRRIKASYSTGILFARRIPLPHRFLQTRSQMIFWILCSWLMPPVLWGMNFPI